MSQSELPLIRTKLAPPKAGSAPVSRDALLKQLDERRDRTLSVIIGPAGCGKTTILIQWRKALLQQGAKVAWYNVGPDDDDSSFAAYLVESLEQAGVSISRDALQLYIRSGAKAGKALLASLINDLDRHDEEIYLVIDDLHYISSFATLQLLDQLIVLAPVNFHLAIGSRTQPPMELARLRSEDQLTELRFNELRFALDETRRFALAHGLGTLNANQILSLHEMTDGWAAGLQLLAFSLRKHDAPETFFAQQGKLSLSRGEALSDYLEKSALQHLDEAELTFLTRISVCRRFNKPLCETLSGDPSAAAYITKFERENLFLIRIDTNDAEPWYRFHRLFASFLNDRFAKLPKNELQRLHELASRWFAGHNLHMEAMRHAELAGDIDFRVELIDRVARRMIGGANFMQLLKWCESVPQKNLRTRLNIGLCLAWAQLSGNRVPDFDRNMSDILKTEKKITPELRTEIQLLQAYRAIRQDDTQAALRTVELIKRDKPPANTFQSLLLCTITSLSLVYANDFEQARDVARTRHRYDIPDRPEYPKPFVDVVMGFSHLVQGHIRLALESLTSFVALNEHGADVDADTLGLFGGYLLEACYQANELTRARQFLERYDELISAIGVGDGYLFTYRVKARLQVLDGDGAAAASTLQLLEEYGHRHQLDRLVAWSLYEQLLLALSSGQKSAQRDLLRRLDQLAERHVADHASVKREIKLAAMLAHAEVEYLGTENAETLAAIPAAKAEAAANGRQLISTRLGFMHALRIFSAGRKQEALKLARQMSAAATDAGMMRVLVDLGPATVPMIGELLRLDPGDAEKNFLEYSLNHLRGDDAPSNAGATAVESRDNGPLSVRERDVIEQLSKALSIKTIARTLDISSGTVKWHLKNIYGKLHAVSREDALGKARALKILD